jgi:hypothetical protein
MFPLWWLERLESVLEADMTQMRMLRAGGFVLAVMVAACDADGRQRQPRADDLDAVAAMSIGDSIGKDIRQVVASAQAMVGHINDFNREIAGLRQAFWAQYPNGGGRPQAEAEFARALYAKDVTLIAAYVAVGGCMGGPTNAMHLRARGILGFSVDQLDGGIGAANVSEFCEVVRVVRRELFYGGQDRPSNKEAPDFLTVMAKLATLPLVLPALEAYEEYRLQRDWGEFSRAGKVPFSSQWDLLSSKDAHTYALGLLFQSQPTYSFVTALSRTQAYFNNLAEKLGRDVLLEAAATIMRAPKRKDDIGFETLADPKAIGCQRTFPQNCYRELLGISKR